MQEQSITKSGKSTTTAKTLRTVGEQIKLARLRRKLSVQLVSERAGISRATLRAIENSKPGKLYKGKEKIKLTEDLTLYAQWEENPSYSINYNLNEGTNPEDVKTSYKKDETVVLHVPTRKLYDFAGWYFTQDFSSEAITGWNIGEKTGDITLYAKWTVTVKAENLPEGTHSICVVGEIDETTVGNIGSALRSNENAKVNIDLRETIGLENIPGAAFRGCSNLTNIEIPANVICISYDAFRECIGLTDIKIPTNVTHINNGAFWECTSLINIEIPSTVTRIENTVFNLCIKLTDVGIPASVTTIEFGAFYGCQNLKTVNYMDTIEQWKQITIADLNDSLLSAKIICTDGIINE